MAILRRNNDPVDPSPDSDPLAELDRHLEPIDWSVPPIGAQRGWFDAPSGRLATMTLGPEEGERVVLVPGVTGSKEDFTLVMPLLAAAGYRVESYDMAGQYESHQAGPAEGGRYTLDLFVEDFNAYLAAGGPAHVLGYSFAGVVAEQAIVRAPELYRSLALMTMPPAASGNGFRDMKIIGGVSGLATGRVGASLMVWGVTRNLNGVSPERLAFARHRFGYTRRESIDDAVGIMMNIPDVSNRVREVSVPKAVTAGSHDLWSTRDHRQHAERIGARLHVYDTGHSPCETTPHQLARDLVELYRSAQ